MKLSPKAQEAMEKVVQRLQSGDIAPIVEASLIELPEDAPAAKYSLNNRFLALAQTGTLDVRGFRRWQQDGRQVKEGTHGAYVWAPALWATDELTGARYPIRYKLVSVHPIQNTEPIPGMESKAVTYEPKQPPPLMEKAKELGVQVHYFPTGPYRRGWCKTDGTEIAIGNEDARTFFHELAHAAHARIKGGELKGGQDPHQETTAELCACILAEMYGMDRTGNAWEYIKQYNDDPLEAIGAALKEAGQVLEMILN